MNRRDVIRLLSLAPLSLSFKSRFALRQTSPTDRPKAFIDPFTVYIIGVGIAKLFSGMFGGQGDGDPAYSQFFKNLSDQLADLSDKLDYLINNINGFRTMMQNMPQDVVAKFGEVDILGSVHIYKGIVDTIAADGGLYKGNVKKFMATPKNAEAVNNLADALRRWKSNLMQTSDNPFYVLYIAMAVHIEYNLRTSFMKQKWQDLIGFIEEDKKWLDSRVWQADNSLEKNLASLKSVRAGLLPVLITRSNFYWIARAYNGYNHTFLYFPPQIANSVDQPAANKETADIKYLRYLGFLGDNELPRTLTLVNVNQLGIDRNEGVYNLEASIDYDENNSDWRTIGQRLTAARQQLLNGQIDQLNLNYLQLLATASTYYSGLKTIDFCNVYLKAANRIK